MKKFIAKATILARMAAMRLNRPLAVEGRNDEKSLEASIMAVSLLKKGVGIMETAQAIHHKSPVASVGRLVGAADAQVADGSDNTRNGIAKPIERVHNLHEQEWRVLKPGKERETRHLRWRK
ncbi:ribose-phosphate pyrophosphokinase, putative [Babesia ovis]|uniref:Ribose-phosphate pyrophosphokinase, putative n=1 Tax=Babesia ovis TaxID=5869 RepID=A0A9W5WVH2_BABOV|nr:ribose-phosphate pyrophosphokinase, putative [Babesia ovis]